MKVEDLTQEQIKEMSQEELFMWAGEFDKREKADHIRKLMLEQLEIKEGTIIKFDDAK